jgi:hypothetical protein
MPPGACYPTRAPVMSWYFSQKTVKVYKVLLRALAGSRYNYYKSVRGAEVKAKTIASLLIIAPSVLWAKPFIFFSVPENCLFIRIFF